MFILKNGWETVLEAKKLRGPGFKKATRPGVILTPEGPTLLIFIRRTLAGPRSHQLRRLGAFDDGWLAAGDWLAGATRAHWGVYVFCV